jgi:hypothetical protein
MVLPFVYWVYQHTPVATMTLFFFAELLGHYLLELGLAFDVEAFRRSYNGKCSNRCKDCIVPIPYEATNGKRCESGKSGVNADLALAPLNPAIDRIWNCHAIGNHRQRPQSSAEADYKPGQKL